ncbi:Pollen Ole e 1 allergen and extensin family protein [Prunus dulcis]|uniref:Pollen Ole e 1 allergen and extensin family protein n=1 Tax=Prunus dulcis TaxID=3755 RepID=A0A4Y1R7T0_PRUDU|nr:Pollen Ole e 1 allergen and extensin family protein [Prunus dulcis]
MFPSRILTCQPLHFRGFCWCRMQRWEFKTKFPDRSEN